MLKRLTTANLSQGYSWEILVGVCSPNLFFNFISDKIVSLKTYPIQTKMCQVYTHFQTKTLLNVVILFLHIAFLRAAVLSF